MVAETGGGDFFVSREKKSAQSASLSPNKCDCVSYILIEGLIFWRLTVAQNRERKLTKAETEARQKLLNQATSDVVASWCRVVVCVGVSVRHLTTSTSKI